MKLIKLIKQNKCIYDGMPISDALIECINCPGCFYDNWNISNRNLKKAIDNVERDYCFILCKDCLYKKFNKDKSLYNVYLNYHPSSESEEELMYITLINKIDLYQTKFNKYILL
jgi:hypothetical protein